mgnify:FL=1
MVIWLVPERDEVLVKRKQIRLKVEKGGEIQRRSGDLKKGWSQQTISLLSNFQDPLPMNSIHPITDHTNNRDEKT